MMPERSISVLIVCILLIPALSVGVEIPKDLQVITEDYAPMNYVENGSLKGISVDLMEEILQRMGSDINRSSFQVMPWYKGYNLTKSTPDTILFSTGRLPERENLFLWAGPIVSDRIVLFVTPGTTLSGNDSIASLKVVVIKDDRGAHYAVHAGIDKRNIIEVPTAQDAIQLMINGTVNAFAYGEIAGQQAIARYAGDPDLFHIGMEIGVIEDYYAFNPETPVDFVLAVNDTLRNLKLDRLKTGVSEYEQILSRYLPARCTQSSTSRERVIELVKTTAAAMEYDANQTLADINAGKSPYRDQEDPDLYAYVFDTSVVLRANAVNQKIVGGNFSGKTDAYGSPFRDEIVAGALENGDGWISYVYSSPSAPGLYHKMGYYQLVTGSDGISYVVGAGRYILCDEMKGNLSSAL